VLEFRRDKWTARSGPAKIRRLTDYRFTPIGHAPRQLDMRGAEATLANWMTDAMRAATGTDVALMNRQYYRGFPIKAGQVDMVDVLHAMGVVDWNLIVVQLTGREITEILDDNVPDPKKDAHYVRTARRRAGWFSFPARATRLTVHAGPANGFSRRTSNRSAPTLSPSKDTSRIGRPCCWRAASGICTTHRRRSP